MPADAIGVVKRELLVRQLDAWIPYALHRSRRATFVQAFAGPDAGLADAALRVFVEFADLLRGRRLAVLVLTGETDDLPVRLGEVQAELPPEVTVHPVPGGVDRLPVALRAAGAAGAPLLAYLDVARGPAPAAATLAAVATGRPAEVMLALGPQARSEWEHDRAPDGPRRVPGEEIGLPLVTEVELVASGAADAAKPAGPPGAVEQSGTVGAPRVARGSGAVEESELIVFATSAGRRLEAFKDAMWAVDEYAGVRYRDPGDPERHLLDITLNPHPGPLRRELLARLAQVGTATVTELREFTATSTVYRAADTNRALTALLIAGQVTREPAHGRLGGDVLITLMDARADTT